MKKPEDPELLNALKYHIRHHITGPPIATELLRSWQLGQDYLISEAAKQVLTNE